MHLTKSHSIVLALSVIGLFFLLSILLVDNKPPLQQHSESKQSSTKDSSTKDQLDDLKASSKAILQDLQGKDEKSLNVNRLLKMVSSGQVKEIILATNEEFTTLYLRKLLKKFPVHITRLARGIPIGSKLEYMDELTLKEALKMRREV